MTQFWLSNSSIENEVAKNFDYKDIEIFAKIKAKKPKWPNNF